METPYVHSGIDPFLRRVPEQCFAVWEGTDPPPPDYFLLVYKGAAPRLVMDMEHEGGQVVFGLGELAGVRLGPGAVKLMAGMYHSIAALSAAGIDVVVDDAIYDEQVLRAAVAALADLPVLFVGLHVPREVAERRERERGDRGPGGAAAFYDLVHAHTVYDLELDTSVLSPEECALQVKEALQNERSRDAMRRLRTRFAGCC